MNRYETILLGIEETPHGPIHHELFACRNLHHVPNNDCGCNVDYVNNENLWGGADAQDPYKEIGMHHAFPSELID